MNCGAKDVSKTFFLTSFLFFSSFCSDQEILALYLPQNADRVDAVFFSPEDGKIIQLILTSLIGSAQKIYGALYLLSQKSIIEALIAAHQKGTVIQLIFDNGALSNGTALYALPRAGIPLFIFSTKRFAPLMHNKFLIFKNIPLLGDVVVSGSMNFTQSGLFNNAENFTIRNESAIIAKYSQEFRKLIQNCEQFTLLK